jgi:hypothetical protein
VTSRLAQQREQDAIDRLYKRIPPEMENEIAYCYHDLGWSEGRIAAYLDRSRQVIHAALVRRGVPLRTTKSIAGRPPGRPPACPPEQIIELGRRGLTVGVIAIELGVSENAVRYHLRKHGVPYNRVRTPVLRGAA